MFVFLIVLSPEILLSHWKIPGSITDWKILETTHFRIHYPAGYEEPALFASVYSEEAAARFERVLRHRIQHVIPVFIYASHQDFSAGNIIPYLIDEGTGGFTDFFRQRVVVPFTGDFSSFRHVLSHEIVHAYQFDILGNENPGAYPLWLMEGMAEYLSLGWDESAEQVIRDSVTYNRMPSLAMLNAQMVSNGYMYYKGGQAVMDFIATNWSEIHIGRLLKELRTTKNFQKTFHSVFDISPEEFDIQMGSYLRDRYSKVYKIKNDLRYRKITNRYRDRVGFNLHPVISPDGKKVAYMTVDKIFPAIVIRPAPGPDVTRNKFSEIRIVIRALRSGDYEEWKPFTTRLSFSPDGKNLLVAGRRNGRQAFLIIEIKSGEVIKSYEPPFDALQYPSFSESGEKILFTGLLGGKADIYTLDLKSETIRRHTNDWCYEESPVFSKDGRSIYYSSNFDRKSKEKIDGNNRYIYRLDIESERTTLLADVYGNSSYPNPSLDGSVVFRSNFSGVTNLYRIKRGDRISSPVSQSELIPLTESHSGILNYSLRVVDVGNGAEERIVLTDMEEGAYEVKLLPPGISESGKKLNETSLVGSATLLPLTQRTFDPQTYRSPLDGEPLANGIDLNKFGADYRATLAPISNPFITILGTGDENGKAVFVSFIFAQLADSTGDHYLGTFLNFVDRPRSMNMDIRYAYLRYRTDFFAGFFRQDGVFPISTMFDVSFNNILYNPNFRLLDQKSVGYYLGVEYPLHRFGSVSLVVHDGRDEKLFRQSEPEERESEDIFQNYTQMSVAYKRDNLAYSYFGPLDGHYLLLGYSFPMRNSENYRRLYSSSMQFSFYHLFSSFHTFVFKLSAGVVTGPDAYNYPFQIGGYYALRGYRFLEFEGTKSFLMTLEYRFNFIDYLELAFPGRWSIGTIRGIFFFDAGSAFDNIDEYRAFDREAGVTRDLHLSFGVGLHWANFLGFIIPGTLMKLEWATPYDTKRARPLSKWRGTFSFGFSFD